MKRCREEALQGCLQSPVDEEEEDQGKEEGEEEEGESVDGEAIEEDDADDTDVVKCWDQTIGEQSLERLSRDAKELWDRCGGAKEEAKSFWIEKGESPRCILEAAALQIAQYHVSDYFDGVEYWTQFRSAEDTNGLDFHFDKDEKAHRLHNQWRHPIVATATYLTDAGAPLVIFDTASPESQEEDTEERGAMMNSKTNNHDGATGAVSGVSPIGPHCAWICYPSKGRHVAFAGNLLHGVSAELLWKLSAVKDAANSSGNSRLSLLVNIWYDYKPQDVSKLPDSILQKMCSSVKGTVFHIDEERTPTPPTETVALSYEQHGKDLFYLQEHKDGDTGPFPLEPIKKLIDSSTVPEVPIVQVKYKAS